MERGNKYMEWVVVVSVLVMTILCLIRVNVIIAILVAGITAGLMSGLSVVESIEMLISGMGGQAETALSYILLGAFAVAIRYTGMTSIFVRHLSRVLTGKKTMMVLAIAGVASLSQNVVPVHIAFIPIFIPPLLKLFDDMRLDRRSVATALTFGLKAPYIMIPAGFGLIFHRTIVDGMTENGVALTMKEAAYAMLIPGVGSVTSGDKVMDVTEVRDMTWNRQHILTIFAIFAALLVQIITGNLIAGALTGLALMFLFVAVPFKQGDKIVHDGIGMMGSIA